MRALLAVLALLVAAPAAGAATNPWIEKTPLDIAHQGGEDEFPSNTMYAFERSLQVGADMLELDVGVPTARSPPHDTTVDRTTNGHGTVASFAASRASRRRTGSRAPTLIATTARSADAARWPPASAVRRFTAGDFRA
jgi:glycerophosphoryl diester phosphodiesterase